MEIDFAHAQCLQNGVVQFCYFQYIVVFVSIYRARPEESRYKLLVEKYLPPANVPNLAIPKTNPEVWEQLNKGVQIADLSVQKLMSLQAAALSIILKIIDQIGTDSAGLTESHLRELTDANRIVTMSFTNMMQVRKDLIRNAMGYPLAKFCSWDTAVGQDSLFPDLSKKMKERDDARLNLRRRNRYRYDYILFMPCYV